MADFKKRISMRCFFCMSDQFELPYPDYQPKHGELIKCSNCGRDNDYTSLEQVAEEEAKYFTEEKGREIVEDFKMKLQKDFAKSSFLKIKF